MYKLQNNVDAGADNALIVHKTDSGCCGSTRSMCQYEGNANLTNAVVSATVDGVVLTFANAANTAATVKAELHAALIAAGYTDVDNVGIKHELVSGSTHKFNVEMDGVLTVFTHANASTTSFTQKCTEISFCDYKLSVVKGDPGDLGFGGSTDTLTNAPYTTANQTQADLFAADLAASATTLSIIYESVAVSVNTAIDGFDLVIRAEYGSEITLGTETFELCLNCKKGYKA